MYVEVSSFGKQERLQTGLDFSNNTWRAVRDLVAGSNIYGPTHEVIPGIGPAWPVSQHVPASLLWQAPFAAFPLPAALFAFTLASIVAIWAAVFVLTWPRSPSAILLTAGCAAFAVCFGGGPMTLILGQPTGFELLGLALVIRSRQPWLAGAGLMLVASTLQSGIPLALALVVLGNWRIVWRGIVLAAGCSVPPLAWEIANAGLKGFAYSFTSGADAHLGRVSNRIDLGGLLLRLGLVGIWPEVVIGLLVLGVSLALLARLPGHLRRLDCPPVLSLVIAASLLCTYHQPYDMLLVGGCLVPVILVLDQSRSMLPVFAVAGVAAVLSTYILGHLLDPIFLLIIGGLGARTAWRAARRPAGPAEPGEDTVASLVTNSPGSRPERVSGP